jgi:hypothetical protein
LEEAEMDQDVGVNSLLVWKESDVKRTQGIVALIGFLMVVVMTHPSGVSAIDVPIWCDDICYENPDCIMHCKDPVTLRIVTCEQWGYCDPDLDGDGIPYQIDNCDYRFNPGQEDYDCDGWGDLCDSRDNPQVRHVDPWLDEYEIVDNDYFCESFYEERWIRTTIYAWYVSADLEKRCLGSPPYDIQWIEREPSYFYETKYSDCPVWVFGENNTCQSYDPRYRSQYDCWFD